MGARYRALAGARAHSSAAPIANRELQKSTGGGRKCSQLFPVKHEGGGGERRTHRSGKDTVEHPRNGHDDHANVVCGVFSLLAPPAFEQPSTTAMPLVAGGVPSSVPGGLSFSAGVVVAPTSAQCEAMARAVSEPPPRPPVKRKPEAPQLTHAEKVEQWRQKFAPNEPPWQPPGPNAPVKPKPEWLLKAQREITNADQSYRRNTNPPALSSDNEAWRSFTTGGGSKDFFWGGTKGRAW